MGKIKLSLLGLAAAAVTYTGFTAPSTAADPYYKGKTITVIVGRSAGSGSDATARSFVRNMVRHIPGKPTIVVKNMKGTPAYNFVYQKGKPGLTVTFTPYDSISPMMGRKAFKADYNKMPFIGSLYNPAMLYISTKHVKKAEDLVNVKGPLYGGQRPSQRFDNFGRMALDILAIDYRYTTGFGGAKKVLNAMRRGEVDIQTIGYNLYNLSAKEAMVTSGKAVPLFFFPWPGSVKTSKTLFGDIPSFKDFYTKVRGKAPSGEMYDVFRWMTEELQGMSYTMFAAPGTSAEQVKILQTAYGDTAADKAYLAEQKKMFGFNLPYIDPAKGEQVLNGMRNAPEKYKVFFKKFLAEAAKHNRKKKKK